ncbi:MAG TPA: methylenetetrahydrofolate reductase [Xanthobacteraceae bacterium]|jgi:methylenetetrahydrofolate reductase (NADPH)|nr:methylenetetrahydrofolate reductase [Xanthobacteraceae bacterium]
MTAQVLAAQVLAKSAQSPVQSSPQQRIAAFMARASFEATRPTLSDIEGLRAAIAPRTPLYISAVPTRPLAAQIDLAVGLAAAGFEPVPHIAARRFSSGVELDRHLGRLNDEAGVKRVLVIGGDLPAPAGPFFAAIEVIESGLLQSRGIVEVGIAGYPDGHPRLGATELDRAIAAKVEAAAQTGLAVHIVTQFGFSAAAILNWIGRLRDQGIDLPVRIGLAGPATLSGLLRYARICGVTASAQGLMRHTGLAKQLFGMVTPDSVLRPLAEAAAERADLAPHIFSFGGLAAAARWAAAAAAGRITLDRADGFTVEPP